MGDLPAGPECEAKLADTPCFLVADRDAKGNRVEREATPQEVKVYFG